jgi:Tfp pilus assembly protein PilN
VGGICLMIVVGSWLGFQFVVSSKADALQVTRDSTQKLREQAEALSVFELREVEFEARQQAASAALSGRINLGAVAESISLILPDEVWLEELTVHQDAGVRILADTPNGDDKTMSEGYKSVAATMVRLSALNDLQDVWLNRAQSQIYTFIGSDPTTVPVVGFEATARFRKASDADVVVSAGSEQ